jgi:cytoskeletal protein CcmA (bactofilin family)
MAKNNEGENHTINLIGTGTVIEGNVISSGDIRIDGTLKGNMTTKGKVIIGETGKLNGEIRCKNLDVEGSIEGKAFINELLSLRNRAKILGNISTNKLAIEPGAVFTGQCDMSGTQNQEGIKNESEKG